MTAAPVVGGATVTARSRAARVAKQAGRRRAWVQSIRCCGRHPAHAMRVVTPCCTTACAVARSCASRRASAMPLWRRPSRGAEHGRDEGRGGDWNANAFKERLLDFDRSSAKRTTVIDDQVDYYLTRHPTRGCQPRRRESRSRAAAREAEAERRRREMRVTLDFATGPLADVDGTAEALTASLAAEDAREADGRMEPSRKVARTSPRPRHGCGRCGRVAPGHRQGAAAGQVHPRRQRKTPFRACSADAVPLPAVNGLINPSLKSRPMFTRGGSVGGAPRAARTPREPTPR